MAWLLDAPDLLSPNSPRWEGKIATLAVDFSTTKSWLEQLDRNPESLQRYLGTVPISRLGRYAEKLLAFYLDWRGVLLHHGLQVNNDAHQTIGEFDFLLKESNRLIHWEFATKFYLFEGEGQPPGDDQFVGPNLADTLGAKMQKILHRQLALGRHPAASCYLDQPIVQAQALIRGWLFYREAQYRDVDNEISGVNPNHCRGFWCTASEFAALEAEAFLMLPRLAWLAPAQVSSATVLDRPTMNRLIESHFMSDPMPLLIALMAVSGDLAAEVGRGFIVPDDWRARAGERRQRSVLAHG